MDFAVLPPEVNSGRMYAGAGPGPMVAATQAWDALAAELSSAAASYQEVVTKLTSGPWVGASSTSMAAAAAPYVAWMDTTAAQAHQTATQLRAAIAAYETAFAATVPPEEIEVNRAMSASLMATNIVGQNTPMITALEAQYAEMWVQDTAAMYAYDAASTTAATLTPFTSPNQNTNPAGTAGQTAAAAAATAGSAGSGTQSTLYQLLLDIFTSAPVEAFETLANGLGGLSLLTSGSGFLTSGTLTTFSPMIAATMDPAVGLISRGGPAAALSTLPEAGLSAGLGSALVGAYGSGLGGSAAAGLGNAGVSATLGQAAPVGGLSVPQSWATASPEIRLAAKALPMPDGLSKGELAGPGGFHGGVPPLGPVASVVNTPRDDQTRSPSVPRHKVIPAAGRAQDVDEHMTARPAPPQRSAQVVASTLSEHEQDELGQLRKEIAELAMERDAAARLIKEAVW